MADFEATDFDAVKISLASADKIRSWSHGEVKKPETINYRTLKPEKDGLFCEKIFGPAKDWECSCGKYKGIRFKGIVCERCGVEVTSAKVRRERMGHIELAAPVSHIWYFKSPTSFPMSRLLDIKSKDLEKVLYFASYIITKVDYEAREADAEDLREELAADLEEIDAECARQIESLKEQGNPENFDEFSDEEPLTPEEIAAGIVDIEEETKDEKQLRADAFQAFMTLTERDLVSDEPLFREMKRYYSMYYEGGMGAEAIRDLLAAIDLPSEAEKLKEIIADEDGQKQMREKAVKRLEVVDAFLKGGNDPANMILDVIPVIPPDLRPMVQLDGGRFAASDLNDLYRRVINRNNRLKRLLDLDAPAIIVNNEKRMLQEAVDALFDNGRRGRPVSGRGGRPLKSLAEALKGKQGRFRQNLLGKRVDYSGRSVIVTDPKLKLHYSMYFEGGMGAEAIRDLLAAIDLPSEAEKLKAIIADEDGQKQKREKAVKRLEVVDAFLKGGNDPANMILDVIPVIPPDLRPMVQLDGGRFAASDLNDLYRRVINRNNRLKRLLDLDAPAIIVNHEKRMLQEAVDALFDNGRRGRPVSGRGGRPLKSLAEALKGKQGRFRQNLLGKRVDYSGRSVIVTDPKLKLHQCGLPKTMALELFKPFVMKRLVELGKVENIKGAKRSIERGASFVWDILEEVIDGRLVLLNRAPTLHRLSIQAFEPVLVEGKAIHLHPLVCSPFNADFDGDQMSVHVPLSLQAQAEARVLMLSANNLRSPASGKPVNVPSQDMIIGVYYLTQVRDGLSGEGHIFASFDDALRAYDARSEVDLQAKVTVRVSCAEANVHTEDGRALFRVKNGRDEVVDYDVTGTKTARFETSIGRIIFNRQCLPADYEFMNYKMVKGDVGKLVADCCDRYPQAEVGPILDAIKYSGFHYATRAGLTISLWDALIPDEKPEILERAQQNVDQINEYYLEGFINEQERHIEVVNEWTAATDEVAAKMLSMFDEENPIYMMADSGARGSKAQLRQLGGMRGLMADMSGETIDLPIKANFREGLLPLEYFISTYGARKGLVDTASHTSDSGYLTRRLVDVAQDVIVREEDCGTDEGCTYNLIIPGTEDVNADLVGRCFAEDVVAEDGTVLFAKDAYIESVDDIKKMLAAGFTKVNLRALLTCRSKYGVCQKCYGWDLSTRRPVAIGTAVGIIAAQSIGEPGTQLTMRTIHSGGVAGVDDITQGLPTVGRMFDVVGNVNEKILGREADLAPFSGNLSIKPEKSEYVLTLTDADDPSRILEERRVPASVRFMPGIEDGCTVRAGDQITKGFVNFRNLRKLTDIESTMHTFVKSVKDVYTSQGVDLNDKHIEVIARQMLRASSRSAACPRPSASCPASRTAARSAPATRSPRASSTSATCASSRTSRARCTRSSRTSRTSTRARAST